MSSRPIAANQNSLFSRISQLVHSNLFAVSPLPTNFFFCGSANLPSSISTKTHPHVLQFHFSPRLCIQCIVGKRCIVVHKPTLHISHFLIYYTQIKYYLPTTFVPITINLHFLHFLLSPICQSSCFSVLSLTINTINLSTLMAQLILTPLS